MAGEIEEHFSDSFRSDSLHTGSISFGRFKHEELSWERRSSFSHNRYLEEVEKYSKPGSVTQKKAYFESHFKKKGMKLPCGFICQDQTGSHLNDNDVFVSVDHEEQDDYGNDGSICAHYDQYTPHNVDHGEYDYNNGGDGDFNSRNYDGHQAYYDDRPDFDSRNYDNHRAYYVDSPEGSEYHVQVEWKDHESKDSHSVSTESLTGTALDAAKVLVEGLPEGFALKGAYQTETVYEKSPLDSGSQETDTKGNLDNNEGNVGEFSDSVDPSHKSEASEDVDQSSMEAQQKQLSKLKTTEMKAAKPRLKSPVNANKAGKNGDVSKASSKNRNSKERESPSRRDLEKPSTESSVPARTLLFKTPRKENCESNSRSLPSKSERESHAEKLVETPQSGSKRSEAKLSHSSNRLKQHASSTKLDTRSSASKFSFKSDERAEKRKEFFMKLEAKMHAKEAEMNHIQAKTQEKAEAEIKQFRKSLNFKATPMPSFYHSTTTPDSSGKKVMQSKAKSSKEREKLSSPGSKLVAKSPSNSKAGSDNRSTTPESVKTPNRPEHLEFTNSVTGKSSDACQAPLNNHSEVRNQFVDKGRQKVNDKSLQNTQASDKGKTSKEQRVESKQKKGTPNARRNMKGVGVGGNSHMGHLAVGVAS